MSTEIWRDVVGYESAYEISSDGTVRSKPRQVKHNYGGMRSVASRMRKTTLSKGYRAVTLCSNNVDLTYKVHRLVAQAFIPNPHNKPQVNHIDGNILNNSVSNLEWVTPSENALHAHRLGLSSGHNGELNPTSKLTDGLVLEARFRESQGTPHQKLADEYGVSQTTLSKAIRRDTWKHI